MYRTQALVGVFLLAMMGAAASGQARASVGFQDYMAAVDDISASVRTYGQLLVHRAYRVELSERVQDVPIFSLQFSGLHYRQTAVHDPNHAQARAKCVAERLIHVWTLMDHGATVEIGTDNWSAYAVRPQGKPPGRTAIFVRNPIPEEEPLRILTIYPEDVAGYPWIGSEQSLAEYLIALIQAHYLLFWKNESNLDKYANLRITGTAEGKVFREIAAIALDAARAGGKTRIDQDDIRKAMAAASLAQRETLCRLAMAPPADWETSSR